MQRGGKKSSELPQSGLEKSRRLKKKTPERNDFNDVGFHLRFLNIGILVLMWTESHTKILNPQRRGKIIVHFKQVVSLKSELNVTRKWMLNRH